MKIALQYFTGTGNSWKILDTFREMFTSLHHEVSLSEIKTAGNTFENADIIGFCFPVYAFGIPRLCRKYLQTLPRFKNNPKVFVIITAGDADESGFALTECQRILRQKNGDVVYTAVIQMPINWTTSPVPPFPPSGEDALKIIADGVAQAKNIALEIEKGNRKYHLFNYPKRFTRFRFYKDYLMFRYLGLPNLWRTFKTYESCNSCGLCARICPTGSIAMIARKPVWSAACEQCMRCVNFCPTQSIYQSMGGDTKGKNHYHEPGFKPLQEKP